MGRVWAETDRLYLLPAHMGLHKLSLRTAALEHVIA
ncbi:hypothetical protein CHEID_04790 [Corynebacterium heidelbergense]|nr:hypothetical protein CHEID_04790 [Corynebacterium heidelbergense]